MVTYRQRGHTSFDPAVYRPLGEAESEVKNNDPITRQREVLLNSGLTKDEIKKVNRAAEVEMENVLRVAAETSFPSDDTAFEDVQDLGSPKLEAY